MKIFYKASFLKAFEKLDHAEQELVQKADSLIRRYFKTSQAPFGLRIKQLKNNTYEARINDRLRMVWVKTNNEASFALLGNHEDVLRYIKNT